MAGKRLGQRRILRRGRANAPAFTLIEMVVVTAIIAMMAALILPNLVSIRRSQDLRNAEATLVRLPVQTRNEAIRSHQPVALRFENDHFVIERLDPTLDPNDPQNVQSGQAVLNIPLNPEITIDGAEADGQRIDVASWRWVVYPDGSAPEAGLTLKISGAVQKSLWIPGDGTAPQLLSGDLPDPTNEQWAAGELEQRGGTSTSGASGAANASR